MVKNSWACLPCFLHTLMAFVWLTAETLLPFISCNVNLRLVGTLACFKRLAYCIIVWHLSLNMWGHTHTHSSPPTQAIFGPFQGPAQHTIPLTARCPFQGPVIPTNHRSVYSDQSQTTQQCRGPNKKRSGGPEKPVSTPAAEDVLAMDITTSVTHSTTKRRK